MIKFIELFAGIGGFRYGLEAIHDIYATEEHEYETQGSAGRGKRGVESKPTTRLGYFDCVWANEIDKYACQIYRKNFGEKELYEGDITKIDARSIPDHELLIGGFPCQSFSIAGKRKGFDDPRGQHFHQIARILQAKKPRLFLLENVKGLLSCGFKDSNGKVIKGTKGIIFWLILSTLDELGYDAEWQVLNSKNFGVPQNRERVFIVGHLRGQGGRQVFPIRFGNGTDNKGFEGATTGAIRAAPGGPKNDTTYIIENQDEIRIRNLTPTECERLQGFPDGWTEGVSNTQRYKCLGNAVTTNVIMDIGKSLVKGGNKIE